MAENKAGVRRTSASKSPKPAAALGNTDVPVGIPGTVHGPAATQEPDRAPVRQQSPTPVTSDHPTCRSCFYFEPHGSEVMMADGTMRGNRSGQNAMGSCHATSALHPRKPSDWCGTYRGESEGIPENLR